MLSKGSENGTKWDKMEKMEQNGAKYGKPLNFYLGFYGGFTLFA